MADLVLGSGNTAPRLETPLQRALKWPGASYVLALGFLAVVFILRALLAPTLGSQALYLFLMPPVLVAGILGGWGPGLLVTVLSLVLHLWSTGEYSSLLNSRSPLFVVDVARAVTFLVLGIGIAWFGERLRIAREQSVSNIQ
ncbi:MAG TPA: hypothetical protein VEI95_18280, partial [Acidobacteriota bacterium]|nr:hypothetical protein [Acidobacteriota bacterium]